MIRRLGAKRWQQLHRLVYLIGIGAVLALLLGFRLWDRRHRTPDAIPSGAVR
jgi:DMSO/TMAO reductase YedYZ heme-binding membrane subunit